MVKKWAREMETAQEKGNKRPDDTVSRDKYRPAQVPSILFLPIALLLAENGKAGLVMVLKEIPTLSSRTLPCP